MFKYIICFVSFILCCFSSNGQTKLLTPPYPNVNNIEDLFFSKINSETINNPVLLNGKVSNVIRVEKKFDNKGKEFYNEEFHFKLDIATKKVTNYRSTLEWDDLKPIHFNNYSIAVAIDTTILSGDQLFYIKNKKLQSQVSANVPRDSTVYIYTNKKVTSIIDYRREVTSQFNITSGDSEYWMAVDYSVKDYTSYVYNKEGRIKTRTEFFYDQDVNKLAITDYFYNKKKAKSIKKSYTSNRLVVDVYSNPIDWEFNKLLEGLEPVITTQEVLLGKNSSYTRITDNFYKDYYELKHDKKNRYTLSFEENMYVDGDVKKLANRKVFLIDEYKNPIKISTYFIAGEDEKLIEEITITYKYKI